MKQLTHWRYDKYAACQYWYISAAKFKLQMIFNAYSVHPLQGKSLSAKTTHTHVQQYLHCPSAHRHTLSMFLHYITLGNDMAMYTYDIIAAQFGSVSSGGCAMMTLNEWVWRSLGRANFLLLWVTAIGLKLRYDHKCIWYVCNVTDSINI